MEIDQSKYIVENVDWSRIDVFCCGQYFSSAEIDQHVEEAHESNASSENSSVEVVDIVEIEKDTAKNVKKASIAKKAKKVKKKNKTKSTATPNVKFEAPKTPKQEQDKEPKAPKHAETLRKTPKSLHVKKNRFLCGYCEKTFTQRYKRNGHMQIEHGGLGMARKVPKVGFENHRSRRSSIPCKFANCVKLFGSPAGLKIHLKAHTKIKPSEAKKYPSTRSNNRQRHEKEQHKKEDETEERLACGMGECDNAKVFDKKGALKRHDTDVHPERDELTTVILPPTNQETLHEDNYDIDELGVALNKEVPKCVEAEENDGDPEVEVVGSVEAPEFLPREENYSLDDLKSDASSDDEYNPKKDVPKWADGTLLRRALLAQFYACPNLDHIFEGLDVEEDVLKDMFSYKKKRFLKRTSSQSWESVIPKSFKLEPE